VVEIVAAEVSRRKAIRATPSRLKPKPRPGIRVVIDIDGKKHRMKGSGTDWTFSATAEKPGKTAFKISAFNEREISGKPQRPNLPSSHGGRRWSNVEALTIEPQRGIEGEPFKFTARTDHPAETVEILIKGKRYKMQGSGTNWFLTRSLEDTGSLDFSIAALNPDGVKGARQRREC
jgi:hypothetical protein